MGDACPLRVSTEGHLFQDVPDGANWFKTRERARERGSLPCLPPAPSTQITRILFSPGLLSERPGTGYTEGKSACWMDKLWRILGSDFPWGLYAIDTVWHKFLRSSLFLRISDFCVLRELIFAIKIEWFFLLRINFCFDNIFVFIEYVNRNTYFQTILWCTFCFWTKATSCKWTDKQNRKIPCLVLV